jgi:hypothetical protein
MRAHLLENRRPGHATGVAGIDVTLVPVKLYLMECMAILGRREGPADGVHDYCCYLRDALANEG